jgi:hypothetical protein
MPPSLESLRETKFTVLRMIPHLCEAEEAEFQKYLDEYNVLLDRFYQENIKMMAPAQYKVAQADGEYFVRLVDLAITYYYDDVETSR